MDTKTRARSAARAHIFKALGHPARLYMVEELAKGERCVCELTELVGMDTSTVSRHLTVLKGAGIVKDEKRGLQVFYTLRIPCVLSLFGCIETVLETNAKDQMALLHEE
ncbi:MAG: metalloregulator ArsR/SmtB family transcription factor [Nitrospiraceae bacterium]|nr:metalloregulator ArsR/SmtB family transcription factor [Nitrospiraceae bacterium]